MVWNDPKTGDVVEFNGNTNSMVKLGYVKNYVIKMDMAKELAMVENNEKRRKNGINKQRYNNKFRTFRTN